MQTSASTGPKEKQMVVGKESPRRLANQLSPQLSLSEMDKKEKERERER